MSIRAEPGAGRQRRPVVAALFGAIDPDRIAMSGHFVRRPDDLSRAEDRAAREGCDPDGAGGDRSAAADGAVADDVRRGRPGGQPAADPHALRRVWSRRKYEIEIGDTGHYAFSDACFPSPDCNPPTTLTQDESARPGAAVGAAVPRGLPERRPELRAVLPRAAPGRDGGVAAAVQGLALQGDRRSAASPLQSRRRRPGEASQGMTLRACSARGARSAADAFSSTGFGGAGFGTSRLSERGKIAASSSGSQRPRLTMVRAGAGSLMRAIVPPFTSRRSGR